MVFSTFSDGVLTACPNIWFNDMGNLVSDDWEVVVDRVCNGGLYPALLADTPRLDACKGCFTPWDVLSMYIDGEISREELQQSPTYANPKIMEIIDLVKAERGGH
jgi:hypothetical protein